MGNRPYQSPPIIGTATGPHFCLSRVPLQEWIKGINQFAKSYANITRANIEQLTELLSGAGITGEACDVLFRAFGLLPQEGGDPKAVLTDVDVDEFICGSVLLSVGPLEEKISFLVSRKDAQGLGWANSVSVFLLVLASVRGVHFFAELWSPPAAAVRDFISANEPANGHWTASELLHAVRQDPYGSQYVENLEKPHSMDEVRQDQQQGWKRYEKALVRLRRQWAIRSRAEGDHKDSEGGRSASKEKLFGAMGLLSMGGYSVSGGSAAPGEKNEQGAEESHQEELIYDDARAIVHEVAPSLDAEALIEAYLVAEQKCYDSNIPFQSMGSPPRIGKQPYYRAIRRTDLMKMLEVVIVFVAMDRPGHSVLSTAYYSHLCTLLRERSEFFEKLPQRVEELVPALELGTHLRLRDWCVAAGAWCIVAIRQQCADELRKIFIQYDKDNSGEIDRHEFEQIVREILEQIIAPTPEQKTACNEIAQGIADDILENADLDQSGQVNYSEFWDCVQHIMSKQGELIHALRTASTLEQVQLSTTRRRGSGNVFGTGSRGVTKTTSVSATEGVRSKDTLPDVAELRSTAGSKEGRTSPRSLSGSDASPGGNASEKASDARSPSKEAKRDGERKPSKESLGSRGSWLSNGRSGSKEKLKFGKAQTDVIPYSPAGRRGSLLGSRRA